MSKRGLPLIFLVILTIYASSVFGQVAVTNATGNVSINQNKLFTSQANLLCLGEGCGSAQFVSLYAAQNHFSSCQEALGLGNTQNGVYNICTNATNCVNVYCNMDIGGYASVFTVDSDLTLDNNACIFPHDNDDQDSLTMWKDYTLQLSTTNTGLTDTIQWWTWERDGTENTSDHFLPDSLPGLGSQARPVQLPAANKTIWFDWENSLIRWDDTNVTFLDAGISGSGGMNSYSNDFYFITDGVNQIHAGSNGGSAVLLTFNFIDNTVMSAPATTLVPVNGNWWSTEEDAFGHVLWTVNGRVFYYDQNGVFVLGGNLDNPNAGATSFPAVNQPADPGQPGLDFFGRVDTDGKLWLADWGHDNGGYFNCGNDDHLGIGQTNIQLVSEQGGLPMDAQLVNTTPGATPFHLLSQNPQMFTLTTGQASLVNFTINATGSSGSYSFYAFANQSVSTQNSTSGNWTVTLFPPPNITIVTPDNLTYSNGMQEVKITTTNFVETPTITWNNGTALLNYTGPVNVTFTNGSHTIIAYANDTLGDSVSANVSFIIDPSIVQCGETITTSRTLSADIDCLTESPAITIGGENLTLNCNGFTIHGHGQSMAILSTFAGTVIQNCTIDPFETGIEFQGVIGGSILSNNIMVNDEGIALYGSSMNTVNGNTIQANTGIYLGESSHDNTVTSNTVTNAETAIYIDSDNNIVESNNLFENFVGVQLDDSTNNAITYNSLGGNENGFLVNFGENNRIGHNTILDTGTTNFGTTSCPYLFTYDGNKHNFVTDVSPGGIMGVSRGNGTYRRPLPTDYTKIEGSQLREVGGNYHLALSEELDEISYFDKLALMTIDHPAQVDVVPTMIRSEIGTLYTIAGVTRPTSCLDSRGNNCLDAISTLDDSYATGNETEDYYMTINLGDLSGAQEIKLIINGYSLFGGSRTTKSLEVHNALGAWVPLWTNSQILTPSGYARTYAINLTGRFQPNDYYVRIRMDVSLFNLIGFDTTLEQPITVTTIAPSAADLQFRGYSRTIGDLKIPTYENPESNTTFSMPVGNFTRYGDVLSLLTTLDDQYAIMHHGDEINVTFPAGAAPAPGITRDYLLYTYDYYKPSVQVNGTTVQPLPFLAMSNYPYLANESYPTDATHQNFLATYNTRVFDQLILPLTAISIPNSFNTSVYDNFINGGPGSTGLNVITEDTPSIQGNTISNTAIGMYFEHTNDATVSRNKILNVSVVGLNVWSSPRMNATFNTIVLNDTTAGDTIGLHISDFGDAQSTDGLYTDNNITVLALGIGMSVAPAVVPGNKVLRNSITGAQWVGVAQDATEFNDSTVGNIYYFQNGTPAWMVYNISSSTNGAWADQGTDIPFDNHIPEWLGSSRDFHPCVTDNCINFLDTDQDGIGDITDPLLWNETNVTTTGVTTLTITVGGNTTNGTPIGIQDVVFLDGGVPFMNFSFDFNRSDLDLSQVSIQIGANFLIVNLSGQLPFGVTKTLYMQDPGFTTLCVKDADVVSIGDISPACNGVDETIFTTCLHNAVGVTINGITCSETGTTISISNLRFSGASGGTGGGGGGSGGSGGGGGGGSHSGYNSVVRRQNTTNTTAPVSQLPPATTPKTPTTGQATTQQQGQTKQPPAYEPLAARAPRLPEPSSPSYGLILVLGIGAIGLLLAGYARSTRRKKPF